MTTNRTTNPIWPQYVVPGHSELKNQNANPYGKTAFVEKTKYTKGDDKEDNIDKEMENKVSKTSNNFYPM